MIVLVLFGGFCGSMNNVFVHLSGQNIGNEMRKDCFRKLMTFSFPQMDRFGTGSLVTRVSNDITQAQLDAINAVMQEDVSGIRVIKACVREAYEKARFGKANGELIKTQLKVLTIFGFMNPAVNALMYLVVAAIT